MKNKTIFDTLNKCVGVIIHNKVRLFWLSTEIKLVVTQNIIRDFGL